MALNASGSVTASLLSAPYGGTLYRNGIMPTDYGFTGQRADTTTGLDYHNARYYDPIAGQFASADRALPGSGFGLLGLSRYAYVEGNPVIRIDPSGNVAEIVDSGGCDRSCAMALTNCVPWSLRMMVSLFGRRWSRACRARW